MVDGGLGQNDGNLITIFGHERVQVAISGHSLWVYYDFLFIRCTFTVHR